MKTRLAGVELANLLVLTALAARPRSADAHTLGWCRAMRAALRLAIRFRSRLFAGGYAIGAAGGEDLDRAGEWLVYRR